MFPNTFTKKNKSYTLIKDCLSEIELKTLLLNNPYSIYALVDELIEEDRDEEVGFLTTFLVLYAGEFENNLILYDISREKHSTLTVSLDAILEKKIEVIDIGLVEFYPIKLYKESNFENI